jgi:hypothetical protein
MTTYIFQVQTKDFELQLKSEVTAQTIEQVYHEAKRMVKKFPEIKGLSYLLGYYKKVNGKFEFTLLKKDQISN